MRQVDRIAMESLQRFEHRSIVLRQQSVRDVKSIVWINADQVRIKPS